MQYCIGGERCQQCKTRCALLKEMRRCRADVFPKDMEMPAQTLLNVVQLARPGMMIEIGIIAATLK